jgi:beta-lactamase regulating signal transducer with metallopeptidase domain
MAYRHQLRWGQASVLAALLLPLVCSFFRSGPSFLPRTAQVWSAPTIRDATFVTLSDQRDLVSFGSSGASVPLEVASPAMAMVFATGMLIVLARLAADASATLRIISDAQTIRRHRSARILASDRICVPFSFWLPARYYVIVPSALVLRGEDLRLAIRHEVQHHRQQDTKLVYLQQLLKAAFFWNPAVHRLEKQLRELQEFACDEALGSQRSISARSYCQCLLRVADAAILERGAQIQPSMIGGGAGKLLKRRIEALLMRPTTYLRRWIVVGTGAVALALMATTALGFTSTIHDRRISAADAQRMAASARQQSAFPIAVNESVVKQLNLLLSTPDGRANLQASLGRMRDYEAFISDQLVQNGMPLELLAVPLVESGYSNEPQGEDPCHGAGLWMFIAETAQRFGLAVDTYCDERLDVAAETDAAIRLFSDLYRQFDDWGLALLAFNAGSARVERAIVQTGCRDVWTLIAKGYENDVDYVPRVMAAILILRNPSVLD